MSHGGAERDVLGRWLSGAGLAALEGITGGSLDVIGVVDRELNLRYVNWTTPGLTREAAVGKSALDLIPPDYKDTAREVFMRVLRTGVGESFETLYRNERGVMIWVVRVGPIRHEGEVIGLVTINTDVTEQRREDVDRDRFFALSLDMLVVITREGLLKRVNPAFSEMLGYDVADLVGKPFIDFVHPDERAHTLQMFGTTKTGGTNVGSFENRCLRRDGTYRVLSWRGTVDPLTGDGYSVARDITEQRQTEAQLRHAQKMEAVGQLAGGIAHDFNNLVQAVLGNVELALMEGPPSSMQEHLHEISGAALRAAELTKQLLLFSRRQPLHPVVTDLNLLLRGLSKLLRRLLPENISIEVRTGEALASVNADPTQLEQVILNLSVNARDAMENGGSLVIETSNVSFDEHVCESKPWARPGRFVQLTVGDTGAGMTPEVRERVFDPFFTTKSHHRGTGLGLATVYGIIQQHGGFLHVESVVGLGTTFSAYLPADDRATAQSSPLPIGEAVRSHGQETILVAEDDEAVRRPVIQLLERAGYRTLAAINGQDAIRLLAQHRDVDLVVLDVVMPELGGPQAWERMRQMRPDLRVIFASGYADDQYRERLPEGAEVLDKPFRTEVLLAAVRRNLDLRVHSRAHMSTTGVS